MTERTIGWAVAATGMATLIAIVIGLANVASVLALIQLGVLVGAPLAVLLHSVLRSWPAVAVVAVALSIAVSALAAQSLVWFGLANVASIVATATAYGVILAWVLSSFDLSSLSNEES